MAHACRGLPCTYFVRNAASIRIDASPIRKPHVQEQQQACRAARHELHPQHGRSGHCKRHVRGAHLGRQTRQREKPRRRNSRPGKNPHALSAGTERLPALRPCQIDLPQFRHRARFRRRLPHAFRRHQSGKRRNGVRRLHTRCRQMAGLRMERQRHRPFVLCERLLRLHVRSRRIPDYVRSRLRRRAKRGRDARQPRHPDRSRQSKPAARPQRGRKPAGVPRYARRQARRRQHGAARENRHGLA